MRKLRPGHKSRPSESLTSSPVLQLPHLPRLPGLEVTGVTQSPLPSPGMWVWGAHPDTQRTGTPCLLTRSHTRPGVGQGHGQGPEAPGEAGRGDSPSNSAWPTPMMMMDMGSLAAWKTTGEGRVRGICDPAEGPVKRKGRSRVGTERGGSKEESQGTGKKCKREGWRHTEKQKKWGRGGKGSQG